jgi:hypothetical protein
MARSTFGKKGDRGSAFMGTHTLGDGRGPSSKLAEFGIAGSPGAVRRSPAERAARAQKVKAL